MSGTSFEIQGGDKAFLLLLVVLFGSCVSCFGIKEWSDVEKERAKHGCVGAKGGKP